MKQKLLLALLALFTLGGSNLFAQTTWTGVSEITSGEEYYIVNDATGLFLTPGNNWGTQATLDESPAGTAKVTLADGKYTIVFTWPSGGNGLFVNADDGSSLFCDMNNQGNNYWTINYNGDNTFSLQLATDQARYKEGSYLTAQSSEIWANAQYNSDNENLRKWRFISPTEVKETMLNSEESLDVSLFVHGAQGTNNIAASYNSLARFTERYSWTLTGSDWKGQNNQTLDGFNKYWLEAWNGRALTNRSASKTVKDMPEGHYKVSAYTVGGNGVDWFAQVGSAEKVTKTTAGGNPALTSVEIDVTETSDITLGIQSSSNTTVGWIAFDNVKLEYTSFKKNYTEKLAEAEALAESLSGKVPTAVLDALQTTINDNKNKTSEYLEAAAALTSAMETANSFVEPFARYIKVRDAVLAINGEIDLSTANTQADEANTMEAIDVAVVTARTALANYLSNAQLDEGETIDLTAALIDNAAPGESGNVLYWDASGNVGYGSNLCEYYDQEGATIKQAITILPKGNFKLTAVGFTRTGYNAELFAGENRTNIATVASSEVNGLQTGNTWINKGNGVTNLVFNLANTTEGLEIGLKAGTQGDKWMVWRSFRLVYGDVFEPYTLVEGKMNADVSAAQTDAENNYKNNPSPATYQALMDAIAAAQASKDAYATAKTAIEKANNIKTNHNLATEDAITTFAAAIADIENRYNDGTLADTDANNAGTTLGTAVSGWHANANGAAVKYLNNGFSLNDFDQALYVNTWSTEGATDGSNFEVPFYEYWTDNANSLGEKTWTGSLTGIDNGLYKVSALVRVRAKNETSVADATGITMDVNGGTAVDVTEGTQVGETQFQLATYEAEGLVKDGNLTVNFNIAADNNISWLSFQNVKYEKVRDLTPEEEAVTPTGITLDKTEVTLTATDNSVTLTPTFDPENATTTVTWASSDENVATVADGVVTGVAPGTATITVASTLNADVKATCTVTVSYPESVVPETYYENDGATRTVYTLGENLIKNGSFEYPNTFYGWTTGGNVPLSNEGFDILTEANNTYIKAKKGEGGTANTSIRKVWPIENGKTYVFSYKIKGNAGKTSWTSTSLTNELGYETSVIEREFNITADWQEKRYTFTNTEGYAYLQFWARWYDASFDNFYLAEVSSTTEGNVDYATGAIPTANIGTGVFQYSQDAIDAANALVQGEATVEDVEAAYEALTTLNSPAEGQLYNIVVAEEGNARNGNAIVIVPGATGANNPTGYGLNVTLAPNTNLNQAVTFTKVSGNNYNISFETTEGTAYLTTGSLNGSAAGWKTQQIQATNDAEKKCAFTIVASTEDNVFYIYNPEHKDYIDYQDGGALYTDTNIDHKAFSLVETSKPSIAINTTAAGWGTTILPFAVSEIPEGVKVYSCDAVDGATLTLTEVKALEANKPYIIEGAWDATDAPLTGDAQGTALTYTDGLLTGVYTSTKAPTGSYVLQKHGNDVAFFKVSEIIPTVGANRAYLQVENEAKMFYFGGDATGISTIDALMKGDAEIYNLSGVKQNSLQKGMNIIKMSDGTTRKLMVK